jgi:hypothetical protein
MKSLIIAVFTTSLLSIQISTAFAQMPFQGSFMMSFKSTESDKDFPLYWHIKNDATGGKMALQVQDEMLVKGVNKRVVFIPGDSTWTMMISFNKIKQGTRIHGAAMYRDTMKHRSFTIRQTNEKKQIEGYKCLKLIVESEKYIADVWITDSINFDLCKIYRLASHCGMIGDFVRKGDWFMNKTLKSMVLEVHSKEKSTGKFYDMQITRLNNSFAEEMFTTAEFKIADIPEGQNCGIEVKE